MVSISDSSLSSASSKSSYSSSSKSGKRSKGRSITGKVAESKSIHNILIVFGVMLILLAYGVTGYMIYKRMKRLEEELRHSKQLLSLSTEREVIDLTLEDDDDDIDYNDNTTIENIETVEVVEPVPEEPVPEEPQVHKIQEPEQVPIVIKQESKKRGPKKGSRRNTVSMSLEPILESVVDHVVDIDEEGGKDMQALSDDL